MIYSSKYVNGLMHPIVEMFKAFYPGWSSPGKDNYSSIQVLFNTFINSLYDEQIRLYVNRRNLGPHSSNVGMPGLLQRHSLSLDFAFDYTEGKNVVFYKSPISITGTGEDGSLLGVEGLELVEASKRNEDILNAPEPIAYVESSKKLNRASFNLTVENDKTRFFLVEDSVLYFQITDIENILYRNTDATIKPSIIIKNTKADNNWTKKIRINYATEPLSTQDKMVAGLYTLELEGVTESTEVKISSLPFLKTIISTKEPVIDRNSVGRYVIEIENLEEEESFNYLTWSKETSLTEIFYDSEILTKLDKRVLLDEEKNELTGYIDHTYHKDEETIKVLVTDDESNYWVYSYTRLAPANLISIKNNENFFVELRVDEEAPYLGEEINLITKTKGKIRFEAAESIRLKVTHVNSSNVKSEFYINQLGEEVEDWESEIDNRSIRRFKEINWTFTPLEEGTYLFTVEGLSRDTWTGIGGKIINIAGMVPVSKAKLPEIETEYISVHAIDSGKLIVGYNESAPDWKILDPVYRDVYIDYEHNIIYSNPGIREIQVEV